VAGLPIGNHLGHQAGRGKLTKQYPGCSTKKTIFANSNTLYSFIVCLLLLLFARVGVSCLFVLISKRLLILFVINTNYDNNNDNTSGQGQLAQGTECARSSADDKHCPAFLQPLLLLTLSYCTNRHCSPWATVNNSQPWLQCVETESHCWWDCVASLNRALRGSLLPSQERSWGVQGMNQCSPTMEVGPVAMLISALKHH